MRRRRRGLRQILETQITVDEMDRDTSSTFLGNRVLNVPATTQITYLFLLISRLLNWGIISAQEGGWTQAAFDRLVFLSLIFSVFNTVRWFALEKKPIDQEMTATNRYLEGEGEENRYSEDGDDYLYNEDLPGYPLVLMKTELKRCFLPHLFIPGGRNIVIAKSYNTCSSSDEVDSDSLDNLEVEELHWEVGRNQLYEHIQKIRRLLNSLTQLPEVATRYNQQFPTVPKALTPSRKFIPRNSHNFDMDTKAGFLEVLIYPFWKASKQVCEFLQIPDHWQFSFRVGYIVFFWILSRLENAMARDLENRRTLEGYVERLPPCIPYTCIGQQALTRLTFLPSNRQFIECRNFIAESERLFGTIKDDDSLSRDTQLQIQTLFEDFSNMLRIAPFQYQPAT